MKQIITLSIHTACTDSHCDNRSCWCRKIYNFNGKSTIFRLFNLLLYSAFSLLRAVHSIRQHLGTRLSLTLNVFLSLSNICFYACTASSHFNIKISSQHCCYHWFTTITNDWMILQFYLLSFCIQAKNDVMSIYSHYLYSSSSSHSSIVIKCTWRVKCCNKEEKKLQDAGKKKLCGWMMNRQKIHYITWVCLLYYKCFLLVSKALGR